MSSVDKRQVTGDAIVGVPDCGIALRPAPNLDEHRRARMPFRPAWGARIDDLVRAQIVRHLFRPQWHSTTPASKVLLICYGSLQHVGRPPWHGSGGVHPSPIRAMGLRRLRATAPCPRLSLHRSHPPRRLRSRRPVSSNGRRGGERADGGQDRDAGSLQDCDVGDCIDGRRLCWRRKPASEGRGMPTHRLILSPTGFRVHFPSARSKTFAFRRTALSALTDSRRPATRREEDGAASEAQVVAHVAAGVPTAAEAVLGTAPAEEAMLLRDRWGR